MGNLTCKPKIIVFGPISALKKFVITNDKECDESIDEEELFHKNDEKVLIISAEPGMGKSLILDNFTLAKRFDRIRSGITFEQNKPTRNFLIKTFGQRREINSNIRRF